MRLVYETKDAEFLSARGRHDPVKGQNSKDFGFRSLPVPAALRALTGNIFVAKHLHRLNFRERWLDAFPL